VKLTMVELICLMRMFEEGNASSRKIAAGATDQIIDAMMRAEQMKVDAQMAGHQAAEDRAAQERIAAQDRQAADRDAGDRDAGDRDAGDREGGGRDGGELRVGLLTSSDGKPRQLDELVQLRQEALAKNARRQTATTDKA
jgi:hypothetical protein